MTTEIYPGPYVFGQVPLFTLESETLSRAQLQQLSQNRPDCDPDYLRHTQVYDLSSKTIIDTNLPLRFNRAVIHPHGGSISTALKNGQYAEILESDQDESLFTVLRRP